MPVTPYGWSKLANEELLKFARKLGVTTLSLRLPKLVGPSPQFRINQGEVLHNLAQASTQRQAITVSDGFLRQQFDLLDVRDAAEVFARILAEPSSKWPLVLNVGTGRTIEGLELIQLVDEQSRKMFGIGLDVRIDRDSRRLRDFGMNVDALREFMGCLPSRPLSNTLEDVLTSLVSASNPGQSSLCARQQTRLAERAG